MCFRLRAKDFRNLTGINNKLFATLKRHRVS